MKKVDNWSQLTQEAEQSFQDQDMNSISEKLAQLDQSILIFQGAPDYAAKTKLLDQLKNRLEATLSSKVISAIQDCGYFDSSYIKKLVFLFCRLNNLKPFLRPTTLKLPQNALFNSKRLAVSLNLSHIISKPSVSNLKFCGKVKMKKNEFRHFMIHYWIDFLKRVLLQLQFSAKSLAQVWVKNSMKRKF